MSFTLCLVAFALATGAITWAMRHRRHAGALQPARLANPAMPAPHRRRIADCFETATAIRADTRRPSRSRPGSRARGVHVSAVSFRQVGVPASVRVHGRSQRGLGRSH